MAKDYAKPSVTKIAPASKTPGPSLILWISSLVLLVGLSYGLYYLSKQTPSSLPESGIAEKAPTKTQQAKSATETEKKDAAPKLDFYQSLTKFTVLPSNVEAYKPKTDSQKYHYLLQTGSFRAEKDAEKQRRLSPSKAYVQTSAASPLQTGYGTAYKLGHSAPAAK